MLFENIINHIILLFFFSASYAIGRPVFNNFLFALAFGVSVLSFSIYNTFLFFGINLLTVSLIFVFMLISIIAIFVINRPKISDFNIRARFPFSLFDKLFCPEFFIPVFLLLLYFTKCSFPLADGDSLSHYSYLPKLYTSGGNFSAGNFIDHGKMPLLHPSLIAFLAYFGTLDIAATFNFYLVLFIIMTLYRMCLTTHIQDKINSNSFCLITCIFLASPLMNFIIPTGRPYILVAYFSTALLYFLLLDFDKINSYKSFILFLGLVGGALVSVNYLGLALVGCLLIAFLIANYNALDRLTKLILISGSFVIAYSLPFYIRTYFLTGDLLYFGSVGLPVNEFAGFLGPIKALFILSTRNNQGGNSCCIGILYLSFFPILLYLIVKRRLWNVKPLLFLFVFIVLYYFIWLTKIPQARSLIGIFPPYLLLLFLLIDLKKPLYKYAIYLFSGVIIAYCIFQLGRFGYGSYLLNKQPKADFVYNILNGWNVSHDVYDEQNEIVNYIISSFPNYDVVFCDGVFPLTLLPNKVFRIGSERQKHNTILLCLNTTQQKFKPLKHFKSYTIYAYQ